jgi:hypothetical protein
MKKLIFYPMIACIFMLNTASMCSSDDDNNNYNPTQQNTLAVIATVSQGTWHITNFTENDSDHTAQFSGYNFTFAGNNSLLATNGTNSYSGVWTVTNDDSNDDNPGNDIDFNIAFTSPNAFTELTEDWHILERTDAILRLTHVSGGDGSVDMLTFQKN